MVSGFRVSSSSRQRPWGWTPQKEGSESHGERRRQLGQKMFPVWDQGNIVVVLYTELGEKRRDSLAESSEREEYYSEFVIFNSPLS